MCTNFETKQKTLTFWPQILCANGAIADFPADNNSNVLFKLKTKIPGRKGNDGTKNVKIRVPLKYLRNFWRTIEMSFIKYEIDLILTWSYSN